MHHSSDIGMHEPWSIVSPHSMIFYRCTIYGGYASMVPYESYRKDNACWELREKYVGFVCPWRKVEEV